MKNVNKLIGLSILFFTIGFNLWLYRLEPTAAVDPNDNSFQFALVDRTNAIFDFADKQCKGFWLSAVSCKLSYLTDHWVPNWAQGYNLPYYYSHLPQIIIVGSYRSVSFVSQFLISNFQFLMKISNFKFQMSLFQYYHLAIYLLLCFFPLSVFLALRVIGLPWIISGIGAFTASQLSTDGLYGLDPSSFLWRGYGLSSQLFAMIWLPLAIAYSWKLFSQLDNNKSKTSVIPAKAGIQTGSPIGSEMTRKNSSRALLSTATLFLVLTTAGHLGIGIMALLGLLPLAITPIIFPLLLDTNQIVTLFYCYIARKNSDLRQQCNTLTIQQLFKLFLLVGSVVIILSYWIVPVLLHDLYHNTSVWDPVWKFDSYGAKDILTKLLAGDLFDFGRFPLLSIFALIGFFGALSGKIFEASTSRLVRENLKFQRNQLGKNDSRETIDNACRDPKIFFCEEQHQSFSAFSILFVFYLALYFGRTTWGPLIDLIPGMSDFHISRFIVGLHITGIFLVPIGILYLMQSISSFIHTLESRIMNTELSKKTYTSENNSSIQHSVFSIHSVLYGLIALGIIILIAYLVLPQTIEYARHNDRLIKQGNESYARIANDTEELLKTLKTLPPSRVYAGRGGNWGKEFRVAETPMFMHISTYGIPTVLWLPETWSPNSDTEQFFSEDRAEDYVLYNLKYVVAPPDKEPLSFWKPLKEGETWKLYTIESSNPKSHPSADGPMTNMEYITSGYDVASITSDKFSFVNLIRLWIISDYPKLGLYPRLNLQKKVKQYPISNTQSPNLPFFTMTDEATYQTPDGKTHSLFQEPPVYSINPTTIEKGVNTEKYGEVKILSQFSDTDMIFRATVEVSEKCTTCLVILRQTYHPSWVALVDGKRVESFSVFPFYTAVKMTPGKHDIIFSYEPSLLKKILFLLFLGGMTVLVTLSVVSPTFLYLKKKQVLRGKL